MILSAWRTCCEFSSCQFGSVEELVQPTLLGHRAEVQATPLIPILQLTTMQLQDHRDRGIVYSFIRQLGQTVCFIMYSKVCTLGLTQLSAWAFPAPLLLLFLSLMIAFPRPVFPPLLPRWFMTNNRYNDRKESTNCSILFCLLS